MTLDPTRFQRTANGCLEWTGTRLVSGYGIIKRGGRRLRVHRVMWEELNGPIPEGMKVCHRCDNPPCAEPTHLFLGTQQDNIADMIAKGRARHATGEANHSKLTEADVRSIRADTRTARAIGADYSVAHSTILDIKNRRKWAHVS